MAHTFTNLLTHAIFSTKDRRPSIRPEIRPELYAYMGGIIRNLKGKALLINGMVDHVHLLFDLPASICISEALRIIKANSSGWVHEKWPSRRMFAWQIGYAAFSVSQSNSRQVYNYIANQEKHHRKVSFKEELLAFLKKHNIQYDERFIWE
jgi:REP element-mobilizing transposase RayT